MGYYKGGTMNDNKITRKDRRLQERKDFREYLDITEECVLDIKKSGIELIAKDEIFVLVHNTDNYWISNYGRLVNNLRGGFKMHKTGYAHYTLTGTTHKIDTYTDKLVAEHFLENANRYDRIWHIDRDKNNCYYKNLICVNSEEYWALGRGSLSVENINRQQEYIPYITLKSNIAYSIWSGIYNRCYCLNNKTYEGAYMCDLWKNNKDAFAEWYYANYYECDGESMAVDKDLLYPGNKEYAPDKCCIIPQTINTMLSNCKKHISTVWWKKTNNLPLGVRYDHGREKYYGHIRLLGCNKVVKLSYWDTPEEAFSEYKIIKEADVKLLAAQYKDKIPDYIYNKLLTIEVKPY